MKDEVRLNKIIKDIHINLDKREDTFHVLSKKFPYSFSKRTLKKFLKYKSVILIGMGGSIIGAKSIYSFLKQKIKKNFIFLDNLDQIKIQNIKEKVDLKKNLFIIISKSGSTIETLVNSNLFKDIINTKNSIIITEKKNNLLNSFAKKKKNSTYKTQRLCWWSVFCFDRSRHGPCIFDGS